MIKLTIVAGMQQATTQPITERVKSFEDACRELNLSGDIFNGQIHDSLQAEGNWLAAGLKLAIIVKALNEGWEPDWDDREQKKYYSYWDMRKGFRLFHVNFLYTYSLVSSRLCFKSEALAKYFAVQFIDLCKQYYHNKI